MSLLHRLAEGIKLYVSESGHSDTSVDGLRSFVYRIQLCLGGLWSF